MQCWLSKVKKVMTDQHIYEAMETLDTLDTLETLKTEPSFVNDALYTTVLGKVSPIQTNTSCIGDDVYHDVEFFDSFARKGSSTVFSELANSICLDGAKHILKHITKQPIYDVPILQSRQQALEDVSTIVSSHTAIQDDMVILKNKEQDVLWMYQETDDTMKDLYNMVFFKFCMLKPLNNSPQALSMYNLYRIVASPMIGVLSPILYFLIPYLIIIWKFKIRVSFITYMKIGLETMLSPGGLTGSSGGYKFFKVASYALSVVFYFQGIFNSFELSKTVHKIAKYIVEKINNVVLFLRKAMEHIKLFWKSDISKLWLSKLDTLVNTSVEDAYVSSLDIVPFHLYQNFGKQLHSFLTFDKKIVTSILTKVYIIHAMIGVLDFKKTFNACYTDIIPHTDKPIVSIESVFHPCIQRDKMVKNDITIGGHSNAIVTGPNAGGKSTFVKSILINVLLSQTIGISSAHMCSLTPFKYISSQINIPDSKGYESLFEAEMYRCKSKLDVLRTTKDTPNVFSFFVMDEIFNSTNPVEGIAGAYAIAKKMSEYPNCVLLFTTHYIYLTKLKRTGNFTNYRMNIVRDPQTNEIQYPYILSRGISKQYIALDLLKKNGFDEDVIAEALLIKDKLIP
jgi:hypothetical protein